MAKKKKKRQYKCGGCGDVGHNKRACTKTQATTPDAADAPVVEETVVVGTPVEEPPQSPKIAIDGSADLVQGHRTPNTRPVAPAAPYDCPTCARVGILALCELEGGSVALRCEHCMNKSPLKTILKWGAFPSDKPASQGHLTAGGRLFKQ